MFRTLIAGLTAITCLQVSAQYKNDNVLYKTVYPQELCRELEKNPGYVLLDVRTPGEFSDTSSSQSLNIGHLEGALNMDSRVIGQRLKQIAAFKNDPVFVYCSHSQRSRRVSKMLADSGFTKVHNINGGLTALYALNPIQRACVDAMLRRNVSYSILPAPALCHKLAGKFNSLFILDVRPDSAWKHIATNPKQNALGYLKGTKHIALANLRERLSEVPKGKEIVVTDLFGSDAAQAAKLLKENGYDKVSMLLEGIDRWLYADLQEAGCTKDLYVPAADFTILGTGAFSRFYQANKNALLLDVRSSMEFSGSHKDAFRNIGYLDKAINIPADSLGIQVSALEKYRSSPVIVYAFSGGPEAYAAAAELKRQGFGQVYVLAGGLFHIRWTAANMPGMAFLNDWVKGVPPENL